MKYTEPGTYKIQYTAEDGCGKTTVEDRTVIVEIPITYRTVLYADGTFIINESSRDEASNIAKHGNVTKAYAPFDPNASTDIGKYIFSNDSVKPWYNQRSLIKAVEIGSPISPFSTSRWFSYCSKLSSCDFSNLDTSNVTDMSDMFNYCNSLTTLDLSNFNTSNVTNMSRMFSSCSALSSLNVRSFNTSNVTNMQGMFFWCTSLATLDLSSFNTANVTNMSDMFNTSSELTTIYASNSFIVSQSTGTNNMFYNTDSLVGGAGTTWSTGHQHGEYARIDNPPTAPGYFTLKED